MCKKIKYIKEMFYSKIQLCLVFVGKLGNRKQILLAFYTHDYVCANAGL